MRIHITGASGSGTSTLGRELADQSGAVHIDADDYYWLPTTPPFKKKRQPVERHDSLHAALTANSSVVLSGSILGWGNKLEDFFDLVVFLYVPGEVRIQRLRRRELEKYGTVDQAFLEWAGEYDEGPSEGRSLAKHQAWLTNRSCPVLRLVGNLSTEECIRQVLAATDA